VKKPESLREPITFNRRTFTSLASPFQQGQVAPKGSIEMAFRKLNDAEFASQQHVILRRKITRGCELVAVRPCKPLDNPLLACRGPIKSSKKEEQTTCCQRDGFMEFSNDRSVFSMGGNRSHNICKIVGPEASVDS
jgi:hypothetical protein